MPINHKATSVTAQQLEPVNALIEAAGDGLEALARRLTRELGPGCSVMFLDRMAGRLCVEPSEWAVSDSAVAEACENLWGRRGTSIANVGDDTLLLQTLGGQTDVMLIAAMVDEGLPENRNLVNVAARLASLLISTRRDARQAASTVDAGVLRLLLEGENDKAEAATRDRGGLPPGPIRVYRAFTPVPLRPGTLDVCRRLAGTGSLVALVDDEITVMITADSPAETRLHLWTSKITESGVRIGSSDAAPLSQFVAAHREAGHAMRAAQAADEPYLAYSALAEQRLLRLIPHPVLLQWAATLLRPVLDHPQAASLTQCLYAWLSAHGRAAVAASELGVDRKTVERRVRLAETLLATDLDNECVRVRMYFALHALDRTETMPAYGPKPLDPARDCLVWLLHIERSLEWATAVIKPLRTADPDGRLRQTLHAWLRLHGDSNRAAGELGVHRNTVSKRLARIEAVTGHSLDYVGNRGQLYLALLTDHHATHGTLPAEAFAVQSTN